MNDDFDQIEEKLKEKKLAEEKTSHKVSGRSVFQIKKIIQEKGKETTSANDSDTKSKEN